MRKTTVTYGVLAFLSANATLWALDAFFGEPRNEWKAPTDGSRLTFAQEARVQPLKAEAVGDAALSGTRGRPGLNPAASGAPAPDQSPAPGLDLGMAGGRSTKATGDGLDGIPADVDTRSLLGPALQGAGFRPIAASARTAIARVARGDADLAIVSRRPSPQQLRAAIGVRELGRFVPSLVVHDSLGIRDLPLQQVRALLAGQVDNWSQIGGPDLEIQLVLPQSDGLRNAYARALVPGDSLVHVTTGSDSDQSRIAAVRRQPGAVTIVPAPAAEASGLPVLAIGGIRPNQGIGYPYGQELFLVFGPRAKTTEGVRALEELHPRNTALASVLSPF